MKMILSPNCSEQVFRLEGDLEEIRKEILKMIDIVEEEWTQEGSLDKNNKKILDDKRKEINAITDIDDFDDLIFPFTCNYETYFEVRDDGVNIGVDVATCNNSDWDDVDYVSCNREYWDIAREVSYEVMAQDSDWIYIKRLYEDDEGGKYGDKYKDHLILNTTDGSDIQIDEHNRHITLRYSKNGLYTALEIDKGRTKLTPVTAKGKLEDLRQKVMVELL